jgi:hypothetical protein
MQTNPLSFHSEYQIRDMIDRLEALRCGLDYGDQKYALETAIECMEYLMGVSKVPAPVTETDTDAKNHPHWTVSKHGFAGELYTCSSCGETYWDLPQKYMGRCRVCKTVMDLSRTEFED